MTDIEKKALALVNEVFSEHTKTLQSRIDRLSNPYDEALCRAVEQHEAFRREVSDAVEKWVEGGLDRPAYEWFRMNLKRFILPTPVDPLVEALREVTNDGNPATMAAWQKEADTLRAAMKARGYEWTKIGEAAQ